jgi:hypothetical protein
MSSKTQAVLWDFVERAGWTAGQQFFAVLLATGGVRSVVDLPWQLALTMAAGAAVVSVVTTGLQYLGRLTDLPFWPDLLVRLAKTFLASLVGSFGAAAFDVLTFDWAAALDLAALTALTALAKGLLARSSDRGPSANPSTLPTDTYSRATAKPAAGVPAS